MNTDVFGIPSPWMDFAMSNVCASAQAQSQFYQTHLAEMNAQSQLIPDWSLAAQHRPRYSVRAMAITEWQRGMFDKQSEWNRMP